MPFTLYYDYDVELIKQSINQSIKMAYNVRNDRNLLYK